MCVSSDTEFVSVFPAFINVVKLKKKRKKGAGRRWWWTLDLTRKGRIVLLLS